MVFQVLLINEDFAHLEDWLCLPLSVHVWQQTSVLEIIEEGLKVK